MSDFIANNIALVIIIWFLFAIFSGFIANLKRRNALSWALAGMFFGFFAVIMALMLPKKEPKHSSEESMDKVDSELKYLHMKKDYLESKEKE